MEIGERERERNGGKFVHINGKSSFELAVKKKE
jgi:hypothetical protein